MLRLLPRISLLSSLYFRPSLSIHLHFFRNALPTFYRFHITVMVDCALICLNLFSFPYILTALVWANTFCPVSPRNVKEKSKVFKYAKWPSKWVTNESLVWDLMKQKMGKKTCLYRFLIDVIFCRLAETAVSGSPPVTWLSRKWLQSGESVRLPS